jgi:poly(hydroxyalkanoate) granule-associated protein
MAASLKTLREDLSQAGRDVWLATLGALAAVEEEGRSAFETLVAKGRKYEASGVLKKRFNEATAQVRAIGRRVDSGLQDTSKAVLHRVGVPSHAEIHTLIARVEALTAKVEAISRKEAADE